MSAYGDARGFVEGFLEPLITGQAVSVGLPLGREAFEALQADVATNQDHLRRVDLLFQQRARELLVRPAPVVFDEATLRLAVGVHQVLVGAHAEAERGRLSRARLETLAHDTLSMLQAVASPDSVEGLLASHFVVGPLLGLYRQDVTLEFRLGRVQFHGEPERWRRLPWRRRPQTRETVGHDVLVAGLGGPMRPAIEALLERAPLTRLRHADRLGWRLDFGATQPVLAHPGLCRHALNAAVEGATGHFLAAYTQGLRELVQANARPPGAPSLRTVARFIVSVVLSALYWGGEQTRERLLRGDYVTPTRQLSFAPDTSRPRRVAAPEALAKQGAALVTLLLERPGWLQMPPSDARLVAQLRDAHINPLAAQLEDARERMTSVVEAMVAAPG